MISRLITLIAISALSGFNIQAQEITPIDINSYMLSESEALSIYTFDNRYQGVKGTPYYSQEWTSGSIFLRGQEGGIDNMEIIIDVYSGLFFVKNESGQVLQLDMAKISGFTLGASHDRKSFDIIPSERVDGQAGEHVIGEILMDSPDFRLVKVYGKEFRKANYTGAYATGDPYDQFLDDHSYFIFQDAQYHKTRLSRGGVLKVFPEEKSQIKALIKENLYDLSKESHFVRLLKDLQSLR